MQKDVVIRLFKTTKENLLKSTYPGYITTYSNNARKLAGDFYGANNDHYISLLKASSYPSDMEKEIVLAELEAIVIELEEKPSRKLIAKPINESLSSSLQIKNISQSKEVIVNVIKEIKKVFIVHGHDGEMKQEVANVLLKLRLEPIILHEQPDEGKTIIEKFETHSDVDFAIILLSPDDFAYPCKATPKEGKYRARQNVIMELGYFIAKLGRNRVVTLYRTNNNLEIPSDYLGVLYKPYVGDWRYKLADEMKKIDPRIDKNLL